ncbi:hypothetical protein [Hoylesella buccalis]|uniref:hypothetical protein n=1 Tax=Hoylesella buccalis TaxID=28127 RepID=UPI00288B18BB|nr:hypothetical protein [Hoylesella buccalis]
MKKAHTYLFQFIVLTGVYYGLQLLFDWGSEYHWPKFMIGSALFGMIMTLLNIYSDYKEQKKRKEKNQKYWETYDKVVKDKDHKKQQEI